MRKPLILLATAMLISASSPAVAGKGASRSCAGWAAPIDGGSLVAYIIHSFGPSWWTEFWANTSDCG